MSRIRMFEGDEPEADPTPSPRTTIVGGRPPEAPAASFPVPVGLQRLLRLAAVERAFLQELIEKRAAVAGPAGVELTASERAILEAVPAEQLRAMAQAVPPPEPTRRDFLRKTAATAVVLLGGAALEGCPRGSGAADAGAAPEEPAPDRPAQPPKTRGISPDDATPRPDNRLMDTEGGAAPHEPPPRPEVRPMTNKGGAAPDEPPPARPEAPLMQETGGAAPDWPPPRPDRVPSPPGGARPDPPPPRPDAGQGGGFAEPPPGWQGGAPDGGRPDADEAPPPRPDTPSPTRGIRPREE
ncbi:MAG TPA: twin-arginine translocation signal domain-containing protein [Myxococcota bacterium]|nr:twin-arginine translocation signal domain-containing protein [Myxococcota bacterium]HRY93238.1 twin-arginine translocation signal domain-containing protein [Myxococcota bacterium]HSA20684.1 twin-arginine translocation signal domain-containing protein [Myxococcota bacterium]